MFEEDDFRTIAELQHLAFCERQWGLMYLECAWDENRLTAEGKQLHDRAHLPGTESRGDVRVASSLRLHSFRLGLTGQADVVEFQKLPDEVESQWSGQGRAPGVPLSNSRGLWVPFPVEYKHGKQKIGLCDRVQLCAQALCLEEMLNVAVPAGAIFYWQPRRRLEVPFDAMLRSETERYAVRLHQLARLGVTPVPVYGKHCESCSLLSLCMPKALSAGRSVHDYIRHQMERISEEHP